MNPRLLQRLTTFSIRSGTWAVDPDPSALVRGAGSAGRWLSASAADPVADPGAGLRCDMLREASHRGSGRDVGRAARVQRQSGSGRQRGRREDEGRCGD